MGNVSKSLDSLWEDTSSQGKQGPDRNENETENGPPLVHHLHPQSNLCCIPHTHMSACDRQKALRVPQCTSHSREYVFFSQTETAIPCTLRKGCYLLSISGTSHIQVGLEHISWHIQPSVICFIVTDDARTMHTCPILDNRSTPSSKCMAARTFRASSMPCGESIPISVMPALGSPSAM